MGDMWQGVANGFISGAIATWFAHRTAYRIINKRLRGVVALQGPPGLPGPQGIRGEDGLPCLCRCCDG